MPASTPQGYPYPLPTEPVAEGAQAIRNLAEALTGWKAIAELDLTAVNTFNAIPQTFDHLKLVVKARSTGAVKFDPLNFRLNGDAGTNYFGSIIAVTGGVVTAQQTLNQGGGSMGVCPGANATAGFFGMAELLFPMYALAGHFKTAHGQCFAHGPQANNNTDLATYLLAASWAGTAAITSLLVYTGAFAAGSRAWLYGISGA